MRPDAQTASPRTTHADAIFQGLTRQVNALLHLMQDRYQRLVDRRAAHQDVLLLVTDMNRQQNERVEVDVGHLLRDGPTARFHFHKSVLDAAAHDAKAGEFFAAFGALGCEQRHALDADPGAFLEVLAYLREGMTVPIDLPLAGPAQDEEEGLATLFQMMRDRPYIVAVGGQDPETNEPLDVAQCFDSITRVWHPMRPLNQKRYSAAAAVVQGQYVVTGGHDGARALRSVERYDPALRAWRRMPDLPRPRMDHVAAVWQGKLLVLGGHDDDGSSAKVDIYDPDAGTWASVASEAFGQCICAGPVGDRLWVCSAVNVVAYDPATHTTAELPLTMPNLRFEFGAAVFEGRLAALGGCEAHEDGAVDDSSAAELYAADRGWCSVPGMREERRAPQVVAMDGELWVMGGFRGMQCLASCEKYSPATEAWSMFTAMPQSRYFFASASVVMPPNAHDPDEPKRGPASGLSPAH